MKIRHDFVTNSSSSSYVLDLSFVSDKGDRASMFLAVSPETCSSADGYMTAYDIYLVPDKNESDISFGSKSIYSAKNIEQLCDLLFDAATIEGWRGGLGIQYCGNLEFVILGEAKYYWGDELKEYIEETGGSVTSEISEKTNYVICAQGSSDSIRLQKEKAAELGIPLIDETEFMEKFDEERYRSDVCGFRPGIDVSVRQVAPITIASFVAQCKSRNITTENLETIIIENSVSGSGEEAASSVKFTIDVSKKTYEKTVEYSEEDEFYD